MHQATLTKKQSSNTTASKVVKSMMEECYSPSPSSLPESRRKFYEQDFDGIAEDFIKTRCSIDGASLLFYIDGSPYHYNGTYYERFENNVKLTKRLQLKQYIRMLELRDKRGNPVPTPTTKSFYDNCLGALERLCTIDGEEAESFSRHDPDLVFGKTKIFRISSESFEPYTHKIHNTYTLDFDVAETNEEPKVFAEFFRKCDMDEKQILSWWSQMSVILMRDKKHNRILYNYGNARSGKGTTATIARKFFGKGFTASLPGNAAFGPHTSSIVVNKALLTIDDMKFNKNTNPSFIQLLLNIVGDDQIHIDEKYRQSYSYQSRANLMISSNEIPNFKGNLSGLEDKFLFNCFFRKSNEPVDKTLRDRMLDAMPQICRKAALMYPEVVKSGYDFDTIQGLALAKIFAEQASVEKRFLAEMCVVGKKQNIYTKALYNAYRNFAVEAGETPLKQRDFEKNMRELPEVHSLFEAKRKSVNGSKPHLYFGVGLRDTPPVWVEPNTDAGDISVSECVPVEQSVFPEFVSKMIKHVQSDQAEIYRFRLAAKEPKEVFLDSCEKTGWIRMAALEEETGCAIALVQLDNDFDKKALGYWRKNRSPEILCELLDGTLKTNPSLNTIRLDTRKIDKIQDHDKILLPEAEDFASETPSYESFSGHPVCDDYPLY